MNSHQQQIGGNGFTNRPLRILWVGPVVPDPHLMQFPSTSSAASFWQRGLLTGLMENGVDVKLASRPIDRAWPGGRLRVDTRELVGVPSVHTRYFNHLNVKGLRERELSNAYTSYLKELVCSGWTPDVVITYNALPEHVRFGQRAQASGVPWVCCAADLSIADDPRDQKTHGFEKAFGVIYLSYGCFESSTMERKFHLDGGIDRWRGDPNAQIQEGSIMCAGTMGHWGGGDTVVEAFKLLEYPGKELWLTGPGSLELARKADDLHIRGFGLLPQSDLDALAQRASVFVNAKPIGIADNSGSFPSKLLYYLSFGKPIVSTITAGMHPQYLNILTPVLADGAVALSTGMEQAAGMSAEERSGFYHRTREFVSASKTWQMSASGLCDWLGKVVPTWAPFDTRRDILPKGAEL